jgi:putative ABC transport system permease protein
MVMLGVARRTVGRRLPSFVASVVALSFAALIVAVCGGLLETGLRNDLPPARLAAAPIVVAGNQDYRGESLSEQAPLSGALLPELQHVPGVDRVIGDVSFPVTALSGAKATGPAIVGHGWSSAQLGPFALIAGHAPTAPDDVVVDADIARQLSLGIDSELSTIARGEPTTLRVSGIAGDPAGAGGSGRDADSGPDPTLFLTDDRAQQLAARSGAFDAIAVFPAAGSSTSEVARALRSALEIDGSDARVLTGVHRGEAEFPGSAAQSTDLIPLAAASGGLMTAVSVFIVGSTLALSVQLRRRQLALLRSIGATPGQVRRLVLGETLLLAIPSVAIGLAPSQLVGRRLLRAFAEHGVVADGLRYHQGFIPTLAAIGAAVLTALIAAFAAARPAVRVRPVQALAAEGAPVARLGWLRWLVGLLALGGGVALAIITALVFNGPIAASTAEPSAMLWALAIALLAPVLIRPVIAVLGALAAVLWPRAGRLARQTLAGRGSRSAAVAIPVLLATGLTTALLYLQTTQQTATDDAYAQALRADRVLTATDGQVPLPLADRAAQLTGVASASPLVTSTGFFETAKGEDPDDVPMQGIDPDAAGYPVVAGDLSQLRGQTVAIAAEYRRAGRDVGDTVTLRFGDDSTARLRIVAVIDARRGYPTVLMPPSVLAAHTTTGLADQILVRAAPGADLPALDGELQRLAPGLTVADRAAAIKSFSDQQNTGLWVGYLFIAALIVYTAVSLINTTVASTAQRRTQLRTLRLIGASPRQIQRAMTIEAAVVAAAGVVLGSGVALAVLLPFDSALGRPGLPAGPWWIFATVVGSGAALSMLVTRATTGWVRTR